MHENLVDFVLRQSTLGHHDPIAVPLLYDEGHIFAKKSGEAKPDFNSGRNHHGNEYLDR